MGHVDLKNSVLYTFSTRFMQSSSVREQHIVTILYAEINSISQFGVA